MNQNIKELWLKALRSGHYQQGRHYLRYNDTYCCLGVLCDLYDHNSWVHGVKDAFIFASQSKDNIGGVLPSEVAEWAGLDSKNPYFPAKTVQPLVSPVLDESYWVEHDSYRVSLVDLNDKGASFEEIANVIEKNL